MPQFEEFKGFADIKANLPDDTYMTGGAALAGGETQSVLSVRTLFAQTQRPGDSSFNGHPVTLMLINHLQRRINFTWKDKPIQDTCFPNMDKNGSPDDLQSVNNVSQVLQIPNNLSLALGGVGFLAKALYCSDSSTHDVVDIDNINNWVKCVNDVYNKAAMWLYMEYWRHTYKISPSGNVVNSYINLLTSNAYRNLKNAQLVSANWPDPDLEMHGHFVKLLACGATIDQINTIYHNLTTTEPKIPANAFPSITPQTWCGWRGWLSSGSLDYGDLGAQNLGDEWQELVTFLVPGMPDMARVETRHHPLSHEFCNKSGFAKARGGGSCLTGDTLVVMADGKTCPISDVQPGDVVLSRGLNNEPHPRSCRVAFISKPARAQRPLYSFKTLPDIFFTATHPIVRRALSGSACSLAFVDNIAASSMNPTWHSVVTQTIPLDQLETHTLDDSVEKYAVLYDLILEPPTDLEAPRSGPGTYVVQSSNGQTLDIASESPVLDWYPAAAVFIIAALSVFRQSADGISHAQSVLISDASNLHQTSAAAATTALTTMQSQGANVAENMVQPSLSTLLGDADMQASADLAEMIIARLGRTINNTVHCGWVHSSPETDDSKLVLLIHTYRPLDTDGQATQEVSALQNISIKAGDSTAMHAEIQGHIEGRHTLEIHRPFDISSAYDGNPIDVSITFEDAGTGGFFQGRGPLVLDVPATFYMSSMQLEPVQHALVSLCLRRVSSEALEASRDWNEKKTMAYAHLYGEAFANEILAHKVADAEEMV